MNKLRYLMVPLLFFLLTGCADIAPPSPQDIIRRPLGTSSVKIGMTKSQVRNIWGEPAQINVVTDKERWGAERVEWVYVGRYGSIPVDAGYLSKTKKLYFDGDNLTNITEE
ncbi:MAG: hypothetical protein ABID09_08625 [Candidatus Omnitrophota bacterium]